ncbi:MAG TPA: RDD family protein [Acidimicrobiia bacterium]|nr:RDD family protein [Acidimicrobiia bacterium]
MHLDDRLQIETPEGVTIELTLAGLGSRFGAAALDILIQGVLLLVIVLVLSLAGTAVDPDFGLFLQGAGTFVLAVVIVGYYILFEGFNGGRTPGKAAFGIQVVSADGTPLTLGAVTLRTLMRLIDFLPAAYAAGAVSIVASPRNQRLGDLVAGTVVIRTRSKATKPTPLPATERQGWDAATVTRDEVALVRRFVERRNELTPEARQRLAADLAGKLRPRVDGGRHLTDEEFLTQLLAEKEG